MEATIYFDEDVISEAVDKAIEEEVDLDEVAKEVAAQMLDSYMPSPSEIRQLVDDKVEELASDWCTDYVTMTYHNEVVKNLSARCDGLATELVGCLKAIEALEALEAKTNPIVAFFRRLCS